jgi:hypothetical protein
MLQQYPEAGIKGVYLTGKICSQRSDHHLTATMTCEDMQQRIVLFNTGSDPKQVFFRFKPILQMRSPDKMGYWFF